MINFSTVTGYGTLSMTTRILLYVHNTYCFNMYVLLYHYMVAPMLATYYIICINARWPQLDMQICILEPLVLTSSVIPCLSVVLFMESRFIVIFYFKVKVTH